MTKWAAEDDGATASARTPLLFRLIRSRVDFFFVLHRAVDGCLTLLGFLLAGGRKSLR